jgi:hypothetical protein
MQVSHYKNKQGESVGIVSSRNDISYYRTKKIIRDILGAVVSTKRFSFLARMAFEFKLNSIKFIVYEPADWFGNEDIYFHMPIREDDEAVVLLQDIKNKHYKYGLYYYEQPIDKSDENFFEYIKTTGYKVQLSKCYIFCEKPNTKELEIVASHYKKHQYDPIPIYFFIAMALIFIWILFM